MLELVSLIGLVRCSGALVGSTVALVVFWCKDGDLVPGVVLAGECRLYVCGVNYGIELSQKFSWSRHDP